MLVLRMVRHRTGGQVDRFAVLAKQGAIIGVVMLSECGETYDGTRSNNAKIGLQFPDDVVIIRERHLGMHRLTDPEGHLAAVHRVLQRRKERARC